MYNKCNARDDQIEKVEQELIDRANRRSLFKRVFSYNEPQYVFWFGILFTLIIGSAQPLFGIFFSRILAALTITPAQVMYLYHEDYNTYVEREVNKWIYCIVATGVGHITIGFLSKYAFGFLAENVTLSIRKELYAAILRKHIGWFDKQENSPAILTGVMAEQTSQINGVAADSLHTQVEAMFAMCFGAGLAFYFCW
jgi:ATP-binding cassette subfamily B (MDR/TAP) protein 1